MALDDRWKTFWMTLLSGTLSISSYFFLYTHQAWVTHNFTRGGIYALLPIGTAFYFSIVHGTFTSYLLHVVGFRVAAGSAAGKKQAGDPKQGEA